MPENTIDEVMRLPATELKGPKDPRIDEIIKYERLHRAQADQGKRAKRSEVAEKVDPDLWKIYAEKRGIKKKETYRRF